MALCFPGKWLKIIVKLCRVAVRNNILSSDIMSGSLDDLPCQASTIAWLSQLNLMRFICHWWPHDKVCCKYGKEFLSLDGDFMRLSLLWLPGIKELRTLQGRSQDFRKEGAKMWSDCAQNFRTKSHAHLLNHVGLVIHYAMLTLTRGARSLEVSERKETALWPALLWAFPT